MQVTQVETRISDLILESALEPALKSDANLSSNHRE